MKKSVIAITALAAVSGAAYYYYGPDADQRGLVQLEEARRQIAEERGGSSLGTVEAVDQTEVRITLAGGQVERYQLPQRAPVFGVLSMGVEDIKPGDLLKITHNPQTGAVISASLVGIGQEASAFVEDESHFVGSFVRSSEGVLALADSSGAIRELVVTGPLRIVGIEEMDLSSVTPGQEVRVSWHADASGARLVGAIFVGAR